MHKCLSFVLGTLVLTACGGGRPSAPTSPPAPPPPVQQNRAPVINSMDVSPTFGIASLSTFNYGVSASDPDGDTLTYAWDLAGTPASGSNGTIRFANGFAGEFRVTVTDSRGLTATDARSLTVGSMTGQWSGSGQGLGDFTMNLTQSGGFVTGTYTDSEGQGRTDPAQPGTIQPDGRFELRIKEGIFLDWTFRGTMDTTGRRVSGGIFGSGFTGQGFVMVK